MNTLVERYEVGDMATIAARQVEPDMPATMTTTLYDLVAAIQAVVEPDREELVVPIVAQMLHAGHATFLRRAEWPSQLELSWS